MSGVKYVRDTNSLLFESIGSPVVLRYRPGRLVLRVDSRELAPCPQLLPALGQAAADILHPYQQHKDPASTPGLTCHLQRVRTIPGGRLVAVELVDHEARIEIKASTMSEDVAQALAAIGARLGHYLTPLDPV